MLARKPLVIWQHGGIYAGLMSFAPVGSVVFFFSTCPLSHCSEKGPSSLEHLLSLTFSISMYLIIEVNNKQEQI